jgi:protein-L-isoaspartate(D-aspartate) O-methyltransferase
MNIEYARINMIKQQIRPWNVLDQRVLELMAEVPREHFVPLAYKNVAFADMNIPLAHNQMMMTPKVEGRILQTLQIQPTDSVLEIGTGSGFFTACLAKSAKHVESVDIYEDFIVEAKTKFQKLDIDNISLSVGDGAQGWNLESRYDVIVLTGSVPELSKNFKEQLREGGRLFAVIGEPPVMQAQLITRLSGHEYATDSVLEINLPPLLNAVKKPRFVF